MKQPEGSSLGIAHVVWHQVCKSDGSVFRYWLILHSNLPTLKTSAQTWHWCVFKRNLPNVSRFFAVHCWTTTVGSSFVWLLKVLKGVSLPRMRPFMLLGSWLLAGCFIALFTPPQTGACGTTLLWHVVPTPEKSWGSLAISHLNSVARLEWRPLHDASLIHGAKFIPVHHWHNHFHARKKSILMSKSITPPSSWQTSSNSGAGQILRSFDKVHVLSQEQKLTLVRQQLQDLSNLFGHQGPSHLIDTCL